MKYNAKRKRIRDTILNTKQAFTVADLLIALSKDAIEHSLILEVLNELYDNGIVSYSEISNDCWAFQTAI